MPEFDVAVVGGGVAGLASASALAERGHRVIVIEARGELGGRATAFRDRETGELVDNGQHVLFGCYRETFAFLRRVGAERHVRIQPTLEVPYLDREGRRSVLRCPNWPPPLHLLGGVFGWDALPFSEKLLALRIAPGLSGSASRLKGVPATVADFLTWRGQRGRIREWLWEPLAVAALNEGPREAAAAPFVEVLSRMFGGRRTDASIALPTTPLHEMYAHPARLYIEQHGGEVRVNALARVRLGGGRVEGIDVRGEWVAAKAVVAAVPWFALETLLTGDVAPLSATLSNAVKMTAKPIVTVNLWYDRAVMDDEFVGLPGRQMQWVFDKRRVFGESASHLSLVASGADALAARDTADLVAMAASEVAAAIPGARAARLVRGTAVREKRATFSVAPGQPPRPGVTTPITGLYLAGDWIDTGLPATIESAAAAGHLAAAAIQLAPPG
jgi:squalene-associated FAD-dependent desaturase